jgi:hypothetical protein
VIITDKQIIPPEDWRYIISDSWLKPEPSAVVSVVALDPAYWQNYDRRRIATIKYRTRAAVMSVCGEFLGLKGCANPNCFLYSPVDSVTELEHMVTVGDEHSSEIEGLTGHGFKPTPADADPAIVQQVILVSSGASGVLK